MFKMTNRKDDGQVKTMRQSCDQNDTQPQVTLMATQSKGELSTKVDEKQQIKTKKRRSRARGGHLVRAMLLHFLWSARRSFVVNVILSKALLACFISFPLIINEITCDDDLMMQYQRPNWFESSQNQQFQQQQQSVDSDYNQQREARQFNLADLFDGSGNQNKQQDLQGQLGQATSGESAPGTSELALVSSMLKELSGQQVMNQEARSQSGQEQPQSGDSEADLLETAQSKAQSNSVSNASSGSSEKSTGSESSAGASTSGQAVSSTPATSSTSPLNDQLSIVSNLIQQAGQLGLTAAQQNVALSEAIINGVTNSLIRNTQSRRPSNQATAAASTTVAATPVRPNNVGQSIDGNIEYDSNQNTINGNIEFPNFNFSNAKPALNAAVKPFLLAALKTVPLKLGSVGWKLLQLLAWKKIYKTHHPKSGEIIIEQEIGGKHGGHSMTSMDKGAKLSGKVGDHLTGLGNKLKTSKMGQSYVSGDDWMSMMRSAGGGGDIFSSGGGWPQASSDSPIASASMLYQRHLLPPGLNPAAGQPAAAAAAAAAATAAAIQSHWIQQQQQQSLMSEEVSATAESQQTRSNQTSAPVGSGGSSVLKRKKASFGGGNWFAATPAQAYVAAAAAANAAASLASQQQQHQQRLAHMMRTYELGGHLDHMQMVASGASLYGGGGGGGGFGGGASPYAYPGLFDNAAAMAVQNAVKLPPTESLHHHPLATADFLDQSDSLSGSSFGSPFSSMSNSLNDPSADHMGPMQRRDTSTAETAGGSSSYLLAHSPGYRSSTESVLNDYPRINHNDRKAGTYLNDMADFDDTPAGKLLDSAINENAFNNRALAIHKKR